MMPGDRIIYGSCDVVVVVFFEPLCATAANITLSQHTVGTAALITGVDAPKKGGGAVSGCI